MLSNISSCSTSLHSSSSVYLLNTRRLRVLNSCTALTKPYSSQKIHMHKKITGHISIMKCQITEILLYCLIINVVDWIHEHNSFLVEGISSEPNRILLDYILSEQKTPARTCQIKMIVKER